MKKLILRAPFGGYWIVCTVCKQEIPMGTRRKAHAHPGICAPCLLRPKQKQTNLKTGPAKHEDTAAKLEAAYDLIDNAPKAPPRIELSVRDAHILRESLSDVRAWADGRKTAAPVGLGHDLDQLDHLVQALTVSPGLTPWDNERAKYWEVRRG